MGIPTSIDGTCVASVVSPAGTSLVDPDPLAYPTNADGQSEEKS